MKPLTMATRKLIAERADNIQKGLRNLALMLESAADELSVFVEIIGEEDDNGDE